MEEGAGWGLARHKGKCGRDPPSPISLRRMKGMQASGVARGAEHRRTVPGPPLHTWRAGSAASHPPTPLPNQSKSMWYPPTTKRPVPAPTRAQLSTAGRGLRRATTARPPRRHRSGWREASSGLACRLATDKDLCQAQTGSAPAHTRYIYPRQYHIIPHHAVLPRWQLGG